MSKQFQNRKRVRLEGYDYSTPGYYFITVCTRNRQKLLCELVTAGAENPETKLSGIGRIVDEEIRSINKRYENVIIDKYVVMPNHVHMIIQIVERINPFPTAKRFDIPNVVGKFKAAVTRNVGKAFMPSAKRPPIWQSSYHDHIIRGEKDYLKIWEYINTNPAKWVEDCFYVK